MKTEKPIALEAYERLAERYAELAEKKAENGFIEHPAMRVQLGDVSGLEILDAGCGPGILVSYLTNKGAHVTGFDVSPKMIELARKRNQDRAHFFLADMAQPLQILASERFDAVVSSLAIDYVFDWSVPLKEFWRVLKPGGRLVFSVQHPFGAFLWYKLESAFGVQYVEATWRGFGGEPVVMPDYYRSFEEIVNPVIDAGFTIHRVVDTKPIEALKDVDADKYEMYTKRPTFMLVDAQKR